MSLPVKKRIKATERGYLAAVIREISTTDIEKVARAVVKDAISGDEKTRNAAREWLLGLRAYRDSLTHVG